MSKSWLGPVLGTILGLKTWLGLVLVSSYGPAALYCFLSFNPDFLTPIQFFYVTAKAQFEVFSFPTKPTLNCHKKYCMFFKVRQKKARMLTTILDCTNLNCNGSEIMDCV